jgi:hypothetical protein
VSNVIQLDNLTIRDLPVARTVRVVRSDCESFEVTRNHSGRYFRYKYTVKNRTHFLRGGKCCDSIAEVREIIRRA